MIAQTRLGRDGPEHPLVPPLVVRGRPMRVLLVNQFFHPDLAATAQIVSDLAEDLSASGARVTAVTGQSPYIRGARYPRRDWHKGIEILRVPTTGFGRSTLAGRMADYLSFFAGCAAQLALVPPQDVVITLSTPPLLSLLGVGHKKLSRQRTRFVYWVQDLYPEIAVRFGVLSARSPATRAFERMASLSLAAADAVVALGETMAERLKAKGAPAERLHVIHNWSDGACLGTIPPEENWFLARHDLEGRFIVLYSGNMGRGHELATLLGAARRLRGDAKVVFLFIGDGAKRVEVERASAELPNVRLLPYQRREDLPYSLGSAGLMAVTLSDGLEGLIVPSKLYGALAARKPVLFIGPAESEVAQIVLGEGCGGVFRHGDVDGVAAFISRLSETPGLASAMGQKGREAFERRFDRPIATAKFATVVRQVYGDSGEGTLSTGGSE